MLKPVGLLGNIPHCKMLGIKSRLIVQNVLREHLISSFI